MTYTEHVTGLLCTTTLHFVILCLVHWNKRNACGKFSFSNYAMLPQGRCIHVQCQVIDHTQSEGISLMGSVCLFATRLLSTVVNNQQHA